MNTCQEGKRIEDNGVHIRVVLCGRPAKLYRRPQGIHEVALCKEHARLYEDAVPI